MSDCFLQRWNGFHVVVGRRQQNHIFRVSTDARSVLGLWHLSSDRRYRYSVASAMLSIILDQAD